MSSCLFVMVAANLFVSPCEVHSLSQVQTGDTVSCVITIKNDRRPIYVPGQCETLIHKISDD